jgi:hypothetical protein
MNILKPQQLTNTKGIALSFVAYEEYCTKTVYIGKSDQGYTAINCVEGEFAKQYYVYDTLQELIRDYYVNMLYMINYCHDATARQILDSLRDERLSARLAAQK